MELVRPHSRVVTDDNGLTWLEPDERSTRVRHSTAAFLLALVVVASGAAAALLPVSAALPLVAGAVAGAGWVLISVVRGAASRLALSPLGLYVEDGVRTRQVGWTALRGLTTLREGRRLRICIDDGHSRTTTRGSFQVDAVRRWLRVVGEEASRRRLALRLDGDGLGLRE